MKKILYLSFYFEPDLCAGSFRNSPLARELSKQTDGIAQIDVITTLPNRYSTYNTQAPSSEIINNLSIRRIFIPTHKSGFFDQINSFKTFFLKTNALIGNTKYDIVFASSSRLFTAYLGYKIAKKQNIPLYLDIRDIFKDTMNDVLPSKLVKSILMPMLNIIENKVFNYASHVNLISGGFKDYFNKYTKPSYSYFANGIDHEFLNLKSSVPPTRSKKHIVYAGNIGEGQGLHKIVPQAAKMLGSHYKFIIIGDGGKKQKLVDEINRLQVDNVVLKAPVPRKELLKAYNDADFLFLHLNDYDAFKKVLPSKIFELGAYDKPIIAGVAGFANQFIKDNISNCILFLPGQVDEMVEQLRVYNYYTAFRMEFLQKFKRYTVNHDMAQSIVSFLI